MGNVCYNGSVGDEEPQGKHMSKKERKQIETMLSDARGTLSRMEDGTIHSTDNDRVNAISALKRRIHNLEALLGLND